MKDVIIYGSVLGILSVLGLFVWLNSITGELEQELALKPVYEPKRLICGTDPCMGIETAPAYKLDLGEAVKSGALTIQQSGE